MEVKNMEKKPKYIKDDDYSQLIDSLESDPSFYCIGDVITIESVVKHHEMIRNKI